ncbi:MAG: hypothetical protein COU40_03500 [Candidatus Moranbacteria bacterium CG10_big_fil_rev_8_21_14_0_10_35_21]|nr:MAG: hypothetical protein COU40_03500 [Candidatus Moranbacteria bacterium CG10_big_fil_rev_8_21_14_0_10_35_21]PJA88754.1 MAG: hypothetical protein CO139_01400 [Candidatus Moranbacteria bacterium CG_4_9_14_3_um_filter_36_9]
MEVTKKKKKKYLVSGGFFLVDLFSEKKGFKVSVGTKFSKKAVERNKMKRQLREIIRKAMKGENKKIEIIACINKKPADQVIFSKLEKEIKELIKKLK